MATINPINFLEFGNSSKTIVFSHANGYPPGTYRQLLDSISQGYHLYAMEMRPLWQKYSRNVIKNWQPLSTDLIRFIEQIKTNSVIGIGHSMGGTATLLAALQFPSYFRSIILIDPVFFLPAFNSLWNIISLLKLDYQLHPLIKGTLRRKTIFKSKQEMFDNYRTKKVFEKISDTVLWDYVNSLAKMNEDGSYHLIYPPEWEAWIYATGSKSDRLIWSNIASLKIRSLIIRGEKSNTFLNSTADRVYKKNPKVKIITIPDAGHLVPLEYPDKVSTLIKEFLSEYNDME
jgi:pimeloyl-ACP methyl ester carboxylesterase